MSIPATVKTYLDDRHVPFTSQVHTPSATANQSAEAAHVSGDSLAKGVVLADEKGFVLAVVPASHVLQVAELGRELGRPLELAEESRLRDVFPDCERGAVPALGPAYGLETVVSDALFGEDEVWFEAGDHVTLVRVDGTQFRDLLSGATHTGASHPRH